MSKTGLKRISGDKFYTKPCVAKRCLALIRDNVSITKHDIVLEPSAGSGAFFNRLGGKQIYMDIEPGHTKIEQCDFLLYDYLDIVEKRVHVIGNPPFGRQSSLAKRFIKKACEFCDSVSFILPKSFKKESMQRVFPLHFHLIYEEDLVDKSFLVDGEEYNVPCVFQIWIKRDTVRETIPKQIPNKGYSFVKSHENPDVSFRRVGVYAGKFDTDDLANKSDQSHYFLVFEDKQVLEQLNNLTFEYNNTVGPRSISKQELIIKLNELLESKS